MTEKEVMELKRGNILLDKYVAQKLGWTNIVISTIYPGRLMGSHVVYHANERGRTVTPRYSQSGEDAELVIKHMLLTALNVTINCDKDGFSCMVEIGSSDVDATIVAESMSEKTMALAVCKSFYLLTEAAAKETPA
jgi:hypothetical protein